MTRFWMVQHVMSWLSLIANVVFHLSWWAFAIGAVGFFLTGLQFARAAEADDKRQAPVLVISQTSR